MAAAKDARSTRSYRNRGPIAGQARELAHSWDLSPAEAIALQRRLAPSVIRTGELNERDVRVIAGGDVAFDRPTGRALGAVVWLSWPELTPIAQVTVEAPVRFPYVPGLLSFRETPILLEAFEQAPIAADLLFVDGHGYAHPRRFGFACHLALLLGVPGLGVAKSPLLGMHGPLGVSAGSRTDLRDRDEVVGGVLRSRDRVRPIYVSVGHGLSQGAAEAWALRCVRGRRIPEPTRLADRLTREAKRRMLALTLEVVVEQRAGERGRWEWVPDDGAVVYQRDLDPMPEHYGCSVDLVNDADRELLDVIIADDRERARAERLSVRVVDVLERADGDHKLLAVPVDVAPGRETTLRRLQGARERVWAWYVATGKPVLRWAGEDAALALIGRCRRNGDRSATG